MEAPKHAPTGGRRTRGKSPYYIQPAKGGLFVVLHKPCGNRITPKVCGEMPSRPHALALIKQLERAESAVDDLFLEATDDGIEALEAVLEACRQSVLSRGPAKLEPSAGRRRGNPNPGDSAARRGARRKRGRTRGGRRPRGDGEGGGAAGGGSSAG